MGSNWSLPALGTWAAPTRRVKISLTARTAPSARSGRESRAAIEGIEDDRDRPPGAGRSGGFTGEATVRADEGIHRETELGERLGVREEPPRTPPHHRLSLGSRHPADLCLGLGCTASW